MLQSGIAHRDFDVAFVGDQNLTRIERNHQLPTLPEVTMGMPNAVLPFSPSVG